MLTELEVLIIAFAWLLFMAWGLREVEKSNKKWEKEQRAGDKEQ